MSHHQAEGGSGGVRGPFPRDASEVLACTRGPQEGSFPASRLEGWAHARQWSWLRGQRQADTVPRGGGGSREGASPPEHTHPS